MTEVQNTPAPGFRSGKYPFDKLKLVNDTIFLPHDAALVRNAARSFGKTHKAKYRVRKASEAGVNGCRIWRIE